MGSTPTIRVTDAAVAEYPHHWEADVVLADGGTAHLRPVTESDTAQLREMHARMSDRTKYLRYFTAVGQVSDRQLSIFTDVDHDTRAGLVVQLGSEIIAAATYHRIPGTPVAEVAFVVEDAHQKRGLGSILLEHLAAAALERGVTGFTAEVLAENSPMRRVFAEAGYAVKREFGDGVLELAFAIEPTAASVAVMWSRERRAEARSIERILSPRSVAVVGASDDLSSLGGAVLANILRGGFTGPVFPVVSPSQRAADPGESAVVVQGLLAYPSVADILEPVDLAVLAVPADEALEVVAACGAKDVHGLVVVTAGFADAGGIGPAGAHLSITGAAAQRRLVTTARANGMRVLGPHCLGLVNTNPEVRLQATLAPRSPAPGRIGLFCHSGALGIALLEEAAVRGLGLSTFLSAGNRADVSGNDLLQYWYDDDRTDVVVLYLESFGNPRKFARLARALARRKPVIVLKSGRHTHIPPGLVASTAPVSDRAVDTVFAQSGVVRVDTVTQAFDLALLLSSQPLPTGDRVAIIANSTALGMLALDACLERGLRVAGDAPIDLGDTVDPATLAFAVRAVVYDVDVDAVIVVYVPPVGTSGRAHAAALRTAVVNTRVPVACTFLAVDTVAESTVVPDRAADSEQRGPSVENTTEDTAVKPTENSAVNPTQNSARDITDGADPAAPDTPAAVRHTLPSYPTPERAVAAIAQAADYARWLGRPAGELTIPHGVDSDAARALVDRWRAEQPGERSLPVDERAELLGCYGIRILDYRFVHSADDAVAAALEIGYPVVVKTSDESFRHRDDQVGVRVRLFDEAAVRAAYDEIAALAGNSVYVQAMAPRERATVSTVLGIRADPSFGALVSFGIGGMATELLDDRAYRAVPLTDLDAASLIAAPRAAPLLTGYRGSEPVDTAALTDLALRLSALADDLPEVTELSLRPVLAGPAGIVVAGTLARLGPPPRGPDLARRLR